MERNDFFFNYQEHSSGKSNEETSLDNDNTIQ